MLDQGFKYKVINTKKGAPKNSAKAYTKTKSEAKKASFINTRGISRVMWGKSLADIGAKIPNTVLSLLKKNNNLNKYNYSKSELFVQDTEVSAVITNSISGIENFGRLAEQAGYKNVQKSITDSLKYMAKKEYKV